MICAIGFFSSRVAVNSILQSRPRVVDNETRVETPEPKVRSHLLLFKKKYRNKGSNTKRFERPRMESSGESITLEAEDFDLDELVYLAENSSLLDSLSTSQGTEAAKHSRVKAEAVQDKPDASLVNRGASGEKGSRAGRKPRKKDPKNAERCRQQREKRKQQKTAEMKDNLRLKRERNEFLDQIAELELEVQALRGQNAVNLSKENELLKFELKVSAKVL